MRSIKIKVLIPALFAMIVLMLVLQGAAGMRSVYQLEDQIGSISRRMERSLMIANMDRLMSEIRRLYLMTLASSTASDQAQWIDQIQGSIKERDAAFKAFEDTSTLPDTKAKLQVLQKTVADYDAMGANFVDLVKTSRVYEAKALLADMVPKGAEVGSLLQGFIDDNKVRASNDRQAATDAVQFILVSTIVGVAIAVLLAIGAAVLSLLRVTRPISSITQAMNRLAAGHNSTDIPHAERRDEIGEMAAAVAVFKQNALERERLEAETEAHRSMSERERIAREEQKAREAAEVTFAVEGLAQGLKGLSDGDLTVRLEQPFAEQLDQLRVNFNDSVGKLQGVLKAVGDNARTIDAGANEIRSAADDLSKRTEQQAASVEQTAAALEQVTTAVKDSAARASEALRQPAAHGGPAASPAGGFPLGSDGSRVSGCAARRGGSRGVSALQVHTLTDATMGLWDRFVEGSSAATFFHRAAWKTILERSFGHRTYFLYAEQGGEVQGVLPLVHVRSRLFGNSLVSTAFGVYGGPAAETVAASELLDRHALAVAERLDVDHVEYRSQKRTRAPLLLSASVISSTNPANKVDCHR